MEDKGRKLDWNQACELLGCGKTKFYEFINNGDLPAYRAGIKGLWVWEADVRALIVPVDDEANS
jgi:excisionase family DNA binding protein